jgi:holin-like protein
MQLVAGILLLAAILALSEWLKISASLAVPAPVLAIVLLVIILLMRGAVPTGLRRVSAVLLRHMALFFIPALVAMVGLLDVLQENIWPLLLIIIVSTVVPLWLTAFIFDRLAPGLDDEGRQ